MEIAVALEDRLGIHLSETDIAGIRTIRDLLRLVIERRDGARALPREEPAMAPDFERWLAPTGALLTALALALYALNRLVMRGLFRLRVTGATQLPETGAFVITSNHVSDLDGMAIAAALPWSQVPAALLGGRRGAHVLQPAHSPVLPGHARLPGRRRPSRRGARKRPPRAAGGPCAGLVSRGLALARRQAAAFPARHRTAAAAQRRAGRAQPISTARSRRCPGVAASPSFARSP